MLGLVWPAMMSTYFLATSFPYSLALFCLTLLLLLLASILLFLGTGLDYSQESQQSGA